MIFTDEQKAALSAKLDRSHVKSRNQAGRELSYVEGWHVINEANRIFGFDGWERRTVEMREVRPPEIVGDKHRVGYMARVRIIVHTLAKTEEGRPAMLRVVREGTGFGSGVAKDLGDAMESAIKEAETDAMKRALMTFGNPFGLALYDKDQTSVSDGMEEERDALIKLINAATQKADLDHLQGRLSAFKEEAKTAAPAMLRQVSNAYKAKVAAYEQVAA
jgi:DNA repair and recombination protein RAD52